MDFNAWNYSETKAGDQLPVFGLHQVGSRKEQATMPIFYVHVTSEVLKSSSWTCRLDQWRRIQMIYLPNLIAQKELREKSKEWAISNVKNSC